MQRVLNEAINTVRATDADPIVQSRAVGYLGNVILKALELGEMEDRLDRLEEAVEEQNRQSERWQ